MLHATHHVYSEQDGLDDRLQRRRHRGFHDRILREKDYHVFATLRNASKTGTLRELSDVELDVTSEASISRCREHVDRRTGSSLDMLVNDAGRDFLMPLLDVDIGEAKKHFDVNFWSLLAVTQAFAPMLIKAKGVTLKQSSVVWNLAIAWGGMSQPLLPARSFSDSLKSLII